MSRQRKGRGRQQKASVYDVTPTRSMQIGEDQRIRAFQNVGALVPTYDPTMLSRLYERSTDLRPAIDAMKTNIEGFGWRLVETIDLDDPEVEAKIRDSIRLEKAFDGLTPIVTPVMVSARIEEIKRSRMLEKLQLQLFFDGLSSGEIAFVELRERTRTDLEVTGNSYWEIIRSKSGAVAQIDFAPSTITRLMPQERETREVQQKRKVSPVSYREVTRFRRFRRYVQQLEGQDVVYFREFGDRRIMSADSGRFYESEADARETEGDRWCASTEMIHFKIHSPLGPYGVPRWIGATPEVLGSRAAADVNLIYFDNKAVPPMAITVSGGTLAAGAAERIKNHIRDNILGRQNFHSILVLEAESAQSSAGGAAGRVQIEIHPLMANQQQDGLFLKYTAANGKNVLKQFRIPKLLVGDTDDFNRATADAALRNAETQLFEPERQKVDHVINKRILPEQNIRYWEFKSGSPVAKDPAEQAEMLRSLEKFITPKEARKIIGPLFGTELRDLTASWTDQPVSVLIARLQSGLPGSEKMDDASAPATESLMALKAAYEKDIATAAAAEDDDMRSVEYLAVPDAVFSAWTAKDGGATRARRRQSRKK